MPAARYDLIIDQGSDFALELTIKDNGSPKDLTQWSGRAQLRKTKEATDPNPTTFAVTKGGTNASGDNGKVTLNLAHTVSTGMSAGLYYYDFEIYIPDANPSEPDTQVLRIISGTAHIRREVTR